MAVVEQIYAVFIVRVVVFNEVSVNFFTDIVDTPVGAIDIGVGGLVSTFVDINTMEESGHEGIPEVRFSEIAATVPEYEEFEAFGLIFSEDGVAYPFVAVAFSGNDSD